MTLEDARRHASRILRAPYKRFSAHIHRHDIRLTEAIRPFAPNSAGAPADRAKLTIQAVNQTFPHIVELIRSFRLAPLSEPVPIAAFASTARERDAADALESLFDEHGSDKSTAHDYHHLYGAILADARGREFDLLEIGLGTNNKDVVSNMGKRGKPGASLRAFRDFLPKARVYGADVDRRVLFQEDRIQTFFVDQTEPSSFEAISEIVKHKFDLVIDDGLHSPNANIATLIFALQHLREGGWFVVEDVNAAALPVWHVIKALLPARYDTWLVSGKGAYLFVVRARSTAQG